MMAQAQMQLWFKIAIVCGLCFFVGVVIIKDLLTLKEEKAREGGLVLASDENTRRLL